MSHHIIDNQYLEFIYGDYVAILILLHSQKIEFLISRKVFLSFFN